MGRHIFNYIQMSTKVGQGQQTTPLLKKGYPDVSLCEISSQKFV